MPYMKEFEVSCVACDMDMCDCTYEPSNWFDEMLDSEV